jgi:hypothetical protein
MELPSEQESETILGTKDQVELGRLSLGPDKVGANGKLVICFA